MSYNDGIWSWNTYNHERRQNEALDDLAHQNARQASRFHQSQRETKARITKEISSVNTRLDTLLSWMDLRFQLLEFDEYQARREVRRCFRALASASSLALPPVTDVPGYWLPPAALPLARMVLALRGEASPPGRTTDDLAGDVHKGLDIARKCDPVRGDLFVLATAASFDLPHLMESAVSRLLDGPADFGAGDDKVASGWRVLWEQAAQGDFGTQAADRLAQRLADRFDPKSLDEAALTSWDRSILAPGKGSGDGPLATAKAFDRLTSLVSGMETDTTERGGPHYLDLWHGIVEDLVNEPSPAELPVVTAMEELRDAPEAINSRQQWMDRGGTVADRLRSDLLDDDTPAACRRLALRLSGDLLRQRVDAIVDSDTRWESAGTVVKCLGSDLRVYSSGPVPSQLQKARERIDRHIEPAVPRWPTVVAAAVLAIAAVAAAVGQSWVLAVGFALAIAVPVGIRLAKQAKVADSAAQAKSRSARLDKDLEAAQEKERKAEAKRAEDLVVLAKSRAALVEVLAAANDSDPLRT
ncbi:MAG: hypothetical protein ACRD0P_12380 [Stackebrandtia sp.]